MNPVRHVGHRDAGHHGGQCHFVNDFAGLLVDGAEDFTAGDGGGRKQVVAVRAE